VKTKIALVAVLVAVAGVASGTASAHFGNKWFTTAAHMSSDIEQTFTSVQVARCVPLPPSKRAQYHAHSFVRGSVRMWDHFLCALAIDDGSSCLAVAHVTGQAWNQNVLTSWPGNGCTPYQLRR
jgi:hypothetical protein